MNQKHERLRFSRASAVLAAMFVAVGVLTIAPAAAASAAPVAGCTISPELQPSATANGIGCLADVGSGGGAMASNTFTSNCAFAPNTDQLPIGMLGFLNDHLYDRQYSFNYGLHPNVQKQVTYVDDLGRITGRVTYQKYTNSTFAMQLDSFVTLGFKQTAYFNCTYSKSGFAMTYDEVNPYYVPSSTATPAPVTGGSAPSTPPGDIQTSGSVTALPGHPAEYIGRINITNTSSSSSSDADVYFNESVYSVDEFFTLPRDAQCGWAGTSNAYHCSFDAIDAGATRTFVVHLIAKPGADLSRPLAVSVTNSGTAKYSITAGAAPVYHPATLQNDYLIEMPH